LAAERPIPFPPIHAVPAGTRGPLPKYQRNRLDDDEARQLLAALEELMGSRRMYRDPDLTLSTLADALGITPHMLSQLLNVRTGRSFFAYVNGRRADALMAALADPRKSERGVLELAFEVGFSSKSTLNSFFKKHTGATPTEFRARALTKKSVEKSHG
jgi:AraC-like DNA-binding protein